MRSHPGHRGGLHEWWGTLWEESVASTPTDGFARANPMTLRCSSPSVGTVLSVLKTFILLQGMTPLSPLEQRWRTDTSGLLVPLSVRHRPFTGHDHIEPSTHSEIPALFLWSKTRQTLPLVLYSPHFHKKFISSHDLS